MSSSSIFDSVSSGYATVQNSLATAAVPSTACWSPLTIRGPYGGADPGDRLIIGDVRRFSDGPDATKQWLNLVKMQAAAEALARAGVPLPHVINGKAANASGVAGVMVGSNGIFQAGVYETLATDKSAPFTGIYSTSEHYGMPQRAGTVLANFSNGMQLVSHAQTPAAEQTMTPVAIPSRAVIPLKAAPAADAVYRPAVAQGTSLATVSPAPRYTPLSQLPPETQNCAACTGWK